MKLENFCCIGANFQNRQNDGKKQPQLFLYRSLDTNETIENMLSDGFFNTISDRVKENDLILLFHPEQENPREIVYCKVTRSDGNIVTIKKVSNVALDILVDPADSVLLPESIDAENLRDYLIALETHLNSNVVHNWEDADESVDGEKTWNDEATFKENVSAEKDLDVGNDLSVEGDGLIKGKLETGYTTESGVTLNDAGGIEIFHQTTPYIDFHTGNKTGASDFDARLFMTDGSEEAPYNTKVLAVDKDPPASPGITNNRLATCGWVNDPEKSLNIVHRSGNEEVSGRKDFLDDITAPNQLDYTNISNCITKIPQDIKLELNNGVLTLKAGSKVYVPNGAGVFDELVINSDKTASVSSFSGFVFYRSDNNSIHLEALQPTSGTTPPSGDGTWYDTDANKIKRYENSSFVYDGISFPLCKCSSGSIDQVFNGFGYIGSTVFALPGVKGLRPNGRNEDETLKSVLLTNTECKTTTFSSSSNGKYELLANQTGVYYNNTNVYNEKENINTTAAFSFHVGSVIVSSGVIQSFNIDSVFHAANDSNVVHKTGNEVISDIKTFIGASDENPYIKIKNLNRSYMDSPATDNKNSNHIFFIDKNDVLFGAVETWIRDTGNYIQINVNRNNHWATSPIGMGIDNSGYTWTFCPNPPSAANSNQIATCSWVNAKGVIRPGMIIPYGGTSAPAGYLVCNGGSYNTSDYPELYNAIGYTWGSDGSKFRVPNLTQKRVPLGGNPGEYGQYLAGKLPNITGGYRTYYATGIYGAFSVPDSHGGGASGGGYDFERDYTFDASRCSNLYINGYNYVTPEGYSCLYIIKT